MLRTGNGELPRASLAAPDQVRDALRLRDRDVWKNLAVLVALPYLKRKLDESYDVHASAARVLGPAAMLPASERITADSTLRQRLIYYYKWFLRRIYPSINAAYYFALLAWNLAYLFDASKYSSPFMWLIGTRIRRMNGADYKANALATAPTSTTPRPGNRPGTNSIFSPRFLSSILYTRALGSLKLALPASIFALKFLEWWHASDLARQLSRRAMKGIQMPVPTISGRKIQQENSITNRKSGVTMSASDPNSKSDNAQADDEAVRVPSQPLISASTGLPILTVPQPSEASDTCPICREQITTPTVSPYGYVYCYKCIFRWVDGTHDVQEAFMKDSDHDHGTSELKYQESSLYTKAGPVENRVGRWENGAGRCAVSGKKVLGGTGGLRRVMV